MAPKEKVITSAYEMFLEKGITGAVAVLAIAALIWAVVKLLQSKDERIKDQALFSESLKRTNDVVATLTVEVNKSATSALAESSRSNSTLASAVQILEKSVKELDAKVGSLRDEHVRVVAALNTTSSRGRGR